jgi:hypothetical protein
MAQLAKLLYQPGVVGPFGLALNQYRPCDRRSRLFDLHQSGWYNAAGEPLGRGCLSGQDLHNIAEGLESGQLFIVMAEIKSADYCHRHCPPDLVPQYACLVMAPGVAGGFMYEGQNMLK